MPESDFSPHDTGVFGYGSLMWDGWEKAFECTGNGDAEHQERAVTVARSGWIRTVCTRGARSFSRVEGHRSQAHICLAQSGASGLQRQ